MIAIPGNVRVWLATGHTDMRRGFPSLARLVQESLKRDRMKSPFTDQGRDLSVRAAILGGQSGWSRVEDIKVTTIREVTLQRSREEFMIEKHLRNTLRGILAAARCLHGMRTR